MCRDTAFRIIEEIIIKTVSADVRSPGMVMYDPVHLVNVSFAFCTIH